ncbi:MAG TPA: hypothetical protein VJ438_03145 [Candidatus Nanoarchaeia archaeon]|nr:hypothetical protein [Candidatus Nanoarchaeia archaeon]
MKKCLICNQLYDASKETERLIAYWHSDKICSAKYTEYKENKK